MKVPEKLQSLISQLKHHGDIEKIKNEYGHSRTQITNVINGSDDSDPDVIKDVADFYTSRKETISDFLIID